MEVQAELPQRKEGNRPEEHRAQRNCGERRSSGQGGRMGSSQDLVSMAKLGGGQPQHNTHYYSNNQSRPWRNGTNDQQTRDEAG